MSIVRCKVLDPILKQRFEEIMFLDYEKACRLRNSGKIEILDQDLTSKSINVNQYKTKVLIPESNYTIKTKFESNKKKFKIAWIQDYSKPHGGAEISNRGVISVGELIGIDISVVTPQTFSRSILQECDLMVLNNIFEFTHEQLDILMYYCFEISKPYIKYDHDHREAYRITSAQLFLRSKLNVFLSPAHRDITTKSLHLPDDDKNICIPLCINTNQFTNKNETRDQFTALVPSPHKCVNNLVEYIKDNAKMKFTLISSRPTPQFDHFSNVAYVQTATQDTMVNLYNSHYYMVHLPNSFWAGERIYFESILCGCVPIVNSNVGHYSWPTQELGDLKIWLDAAPYSFWKEIRRFF